MVQEYVVDASVLIQGFIHEVDTPRVQTLLKGLFNPEPAVLHVPEFCILECSNILWKRVQFHNTPQVITQKSLNNLLTTPLTIQPVFDVLPRALTIGIEQNLAIYDAVYIAIAEKFNYPLITVDTRQSKAATTIGVAVKPLTDFSVFTP